MDTDHLKPISDFEWHLKSDSHNPVPGVIFADRKLLRDMDEKVHEQLANVTRLPGLVQAAFAMPDAHWGYGFPIGGVAAFDAHRGGVISAGGVGFDIACGVRTLHSGLTIDDIQPIKKELADELARAIPAGVGSRGKIHLNDNSMDAMLSGGARWAVEQGYGSSTDLERCEESGGMAGARPDCVSLQAKKRQQNEMGTLGSGNHYLEVQLVKEIYNEAVATTFGIKQGDIKLSLHCGSRGLGHQIGTDYLREMVTTAAHHGIKLPDRELASAPLDSELGRCYLGAMNAGINCALANRQILTYLVRQVFERILPLADLQLLYDVSHNTCKLETHLVDGHLRELYVHRKGATRAFGPGHPALPAALRHAGQPVLIGGSMGTASYILAGTRDSGQKAFASSCHGAGRTMSRTRAKKTWQGRQVIADLAHRGIEVRSPSYSGVAEEAPGAYKDVSAVVEVAHQARLSKKVAKLVPLIVIKG